MADIIIWFGMVAASLAIAAVPIAAVHLWLIGQRHPVRAKARRK